MENQSSSMLPCSWSSSSISKLKSTGNTNVIKNVGTKLKNQQPKQCSNCGTLTSSMWRRTANKQVACNACGLYYKLYGVNRPVEMRKDIVYPRNRYSKLTGSSKTGNKNSGITIGSVGGTSMLKSSSFHQTINGHHHPHFSMLKHQNNFVGNLHQFNPTKLPTEMQQNPKVFVISGNDDLNKNSHSSDQPISLINKQPSAFQNHSPSIVNNNHNKIIGNSSNVINSMAKQTSSAQNMIKSLYNLADIKSENSSDSTPDHTNNNHDNDSQHDNDGDDPSPIEPFQPHIKSEQNSDDDDDNDDDNGTHERKLTISDEQTKNVTSHLDNNNGHSNDDNSDNVSCLNIFI